MKLDYSNRKIKSIYFIVPIFLVIIGTIVYFFLIPDICGIMIPIKKWLFTDSQQIANMIQSSNKILSKISTVNFFKIFWLIYLIMLIVSLYVLGRKFQVKSDPNGFNAVFIKKEPYFIFKKIHDNFKCLGLSYNNKEFADLLYVMKCLEERLYIESDFGYGNDEIINCENEIAKQLQYLLETSMNIEMIDLSQEIHKLNITFIKINDLLQERIILKRH